MNHCPIGPPGSRMISRSLKSRVRKGRTAAKVSGPPRFSSKMPVFIEGRARSDGAREDRLLLRLVLLEICVECHADVPHEEASRLGDFDLALVPANEAVGHGARVQLAQRIREILVELDPVSSLERGNVEVEIAHQLLDYVAADLVVATPLESALDRRQALVESVLVAVQLLRVLCERAADVADRGDAKPDVIAGRMRR